MLTDYLINLKITPALVALLVYRYLLDDYLASEFNYKTSSPHFWPISDPAFVEFLIL